jgi:hypothetical protein
MVVHRWSIANVILAAAESVPERTDFECIALDRIESMPARRGIAIWNGLRKGRRFPSRKELKPRDAAPIMQYMSLIVVIDGGEDFENRFVGDAVVRAHEVPITHRRFSDVAKDIPVLMEQLLVLCRKVVATREPLAYRGRTGHDMSGVVYTGFEGVLLPFGETGEAVDHVVYVGTCVLQVMPPLGR